MSYPYTDWLLSLGSRRVTLPPAVRGLAYSKTVSYPGDVRTATIRGTAKAAPDQATELATFTFGTPSLIDGRTVWAFSLPGGFGANSTGALPADDDGNGVVNLVFDFLITLPGLSEDRLVGGIFPLSGFVTEPA